MVLKSDMSIARARVDTRVSGDRSPNTVHDVIRRFSLQQDSTDQHSRGIMSEIFKGYVYAKKPVSRSLVDVRMPNNTPERNCHSRAQRQLAIPKPRLWKMHITLSDGPDDTFQTMLKKIGRRRVLLYRGFYEDIEQTLQDVQVY
ncbi:hypothetical protein ACJJTC_009234 [Scirpophaga incertulas]